MKESRLYSSKPSYHITSTSTTAAKIVVKTITVFFPYSSRRHLLQTEATCNRFLHMQGVTTVYLRDHACHHVNHIPHGPILPYTFHSLRTVLNGVTGLLAHGDGPLASACLVHGVLLRPRQQMSQFSLPETQNTKHEAQGTRRPVQHEARSTWQIQVHGSPFREQVFAVCNPTSSTQLRHSSLTFATR
jgi:hypothetical protein